MTKRDDAPPRVTPPTIRTIRSEVPRTGALPQDQPALGRYFDEILGVLGSAIRALERTPGRYHEWDEESLRDALLIPLNSHRPEFEHWLVGARGQKARIRWTDDRARTATLALAVCHLHGA